MSSGGSAGGSGGGVATASSATAMKRSDEARVQMRQQQARGAKEVAKLTGESSSHPDQKTQDVCGGQQQQQQQQQVSKQVFGLNPRAHRQKAAGTPQSQKSPPDRGAAAASVVRAGDKPAETGTGSGQVPVRKSTGPRASKYGNYYKPQDLTSQQFEPISSSNKMTKAASSDTQMARGSAESLDTSSSSGGGSGSKQAVDGGATGRPSSSSSSISRHASGRSTSSSSRRKSFDDDISTLKLESNAVSLQQQQQQQQQQQPILKTRTQFNILPPPQLTIATTGTGSVVNYAKSRIYDRPVRRILANPPEETYSILDDRSGQIPLSILSGFKPPKQINVAKARKKWEGGEPFAKCKSRKRLAAQAQKKLFPGTWSMTSVVATQQLHLQQALAQSAGTASLRSKPTLETDPSVKVLTRGSVLERVQQFEKVPSAGTRALSGLSLPGSDDEDDDEDGDDEDSSAFPSTSSLTDGPGGQLSRSSSVSSQTSVSSLGSDGGATVMQQVPTVGQPQASSRPSKTQAGAPKTQQGANPPTSAASVATRRLSLRRRSSLGLRRASTENLIPKFYHPNGKPNTYEIEIQKRNIVACFDKFPDRRAQLAQTGPGLPLARKQFHQISLACGYSEYFKVPLQRFVSHKLQTDPKLIQMVSASNQAVSRQRKSSTIALNTNGSGGLLTRPLVKAASLDTTRDLQADSTKKQTAKSLASNVQADDDKKGLAESVSCEQFLACWRDLISQAYDNAAQFIHLLTLGQRNALVPDDFVPLVQSIIDDHPGLKFLRAAPDFHMRYIQTVIARIYFNINRSWTGKLSLQELRKSNLLSVLQTLAQEEDINKIRDYFSYEHFYVIYCKFWNLDQDHDLFISKEDLARHNDAAISSRIIERIFSGIVSKQIAKTGRMSYADFVWFLIAEEDKKHPRSVEYWFRLMDIDGDGYISMYEMEYFYYEQTKRLELMNIEALPFLDSACQILDLVNPREKNKISLADLKRTKMATIFFDTFINLEKYLEHESREFVSTRDIIQNGVVISDWDRYASEEYENLVSEESSV